MNYKEALEYLDQLEMFGVKLGLHNITKLLAMLDNPQSSIKTIHVAGTNGKGSTCAMLSSIIKNSSKVGLYTSPHLIKVNERIKINDTDISDEDFARYATIVKEQVEETTYFEFLTAVAFLYFKENNINYAVIEVGMGGRLDATNVIEPILSIITDISLEHMHALGSTIEEIAYEKAGIIKQNIPVIINEDNKGIEVIKNICNEKNSELMIAEDIDYETNLLGDFQDNNKNLAVQAAKFLNIPEHHIISGLNNVNWPGRMHYLEKNILLDCCHNPEAAQALREELNDLYYDKLYLVLGFLDDKDYSTILNTLMPLAHDTIICKPKSKRAINPLEITTKVPRTIPIADPDTALRYAKHKAKPEDLVVVTGSIYLIGQILDQK